VPQHRFEANNKGRLDHCTVTPAETPESSIFRKYLSPFLETDVYDVSNKEKDIVFDAN
jgi:hypothetical protein